MQFTDSVPKITREETDGESGLRYEKIEEGVCRFLKNHGGGKVLVVSDGNSFPHLAPFTRLKRAVSLVMEGDALPLFSMPDGIACVLACGLAPTIRAVRFYAAVNGLPCMVFPLEGTLCGCLEESAVVLVDGSEREVSLKPCETVIDLDRICLSEGYAMYSLYRLQAFERAALRAFDGELFEFERGDARRFCEPKELIGEIVRLYAEDNGAFEGKILFELHERAAESYPAVRSFRELFALYYAFFKCGKPRRYRVPDYKTRAAVAEVAYSSVGIPSVSEYLQRAVALERIRANCLEALKAIRAEFLACPLEAACKFELDGNVLKKLPELGGGLSAVIRDFGLLETT